MRQMICAPNVRFHTQGGKSLLRVLRVLNLEALETIQIAGRQFFSNYEFGRLPLLIGIYHQHLECNMPGLLAVRKSRMASIESPIETDSFSDKENDQAIEESHFVRRSIRKMAKPEFFSPPSDKQRKKSRSPSQLSSDNTSPVYSPTPSEHETTDDNRNRNEESEEDFTDHEISFKKPATPNPRGRKRKSITQGKEDVKKARKDSIGKKKQQGTRRKQADEADDEEQSLFDIVKGGRTALRAVLDDWIETYNEDREGAMVYLIQFFIQCCGCKGKVTRDMIEAEETVQAIRQLTETFDEDSHEYPLIGTGPANKKFKSNLSHFVELLINQGQYNIIYDEIMMDTLISWLIGLSDSQVRAFRHTSTFAGMKVVTALIDVALKVSIESDNTQRQLDAENKKPVAKRSREKVELLQRKREELRQNVADLQEMMTRIFSGIFVHRYRDVRPEIRAICIAEIGIWMKNYSSFFGIAEQTYTKYIGWTLHDKVGEVRLTALQVLQGLYEHESFVPQLELFTERFKERIVCMTLDKEGDVCVEAIRLVGLFFKHDLLMEDDASQVDQLVFCDQRAVAHAAGEFLDMRLFYQGTEDEMDVIIKSPTRGRKGTKGALIKQTNMKYLVEFFINSEIHNHAAYLVDSLWEYTDLIKDWTNYTNILLDSNCLIELSDAEETALIEIMTASCKHAALGHGPPGRVVKKNVGAKERRHLIEERHNLSTHFMDLLPHLLAKFEADAEKTTNLISIPQCFELEVYAEKRLRKHLEDLLGHLESIILKHGDEKLLETCSKTLQYLTDNDLIIQQTAELARHRIVDQVVEKFQTIVKAGVPAEAEEKDEPEYYNFLISLKRIAALYKAHDLRGWELQRDLHAIIDQGAKDVMDDDILKFSLNCMHTSILWSLVDLDPNKPSKSELKALKKRLNSFISQLDQLVQYSSDTIKCEAFLILCDLLVFFAVQLKNTTPLLGPLVYEADLSIQVRLRDFTMYHVFANIDDEDDIEEEDEGEDAKAQELDQKRTVLSAFCKLIAFNVFDMKLAAPVFAQLIRAYSGYSDIIKHTMSKAREINAIAFAKTLLLSLQQAFEVLKEEEGEIVTSSDGFRSLCDLSRRFALLLGVNIKSDQSRKCSLTLHRDGIIYALAHAEIDEETNEAVPRNLAFFQVLHEFIYRLASQDRTGKHGVLPFFEEQAKKYLKKTGEVWTPMIMYKNGLHAKELVTMPTDEQHDPMQGVAPPKLPGKQKRSVGRGRAKKKLSMEKGDARPGEWLNSKTSVAQAINISNNDVERLADAETSDEEITSTLKRTPKQPVASNAQGKSAEKSTVITSPRSRGRPRKEKPFERTSRTVEEAAESPSQEASTDSDFQRNFKTLISKQKEGLNPSGKLTPAKRGRESSPESTNITEDESMNDQSSSQESSHKKSPVKQTRKKQKQQFPANLFEASEGTPEGEMSSQESDLPSVF